MDGSSKIYEIRRYLPEDQEQVLALLGWGLHGWSACPDRQALWRWKHYSSPFGPSHIVVAIDSQDEVIAVSAGMQWHLWREDRFLKTIKIGDVVTRQDCQNKGIALALRLRLMETARQEGIALAWNTPNRYTFPVSLKAGSHMAGKINLSLRILDYSRFLPGVIRSRLGRQTTSSRQPREFFHREPLLVRDLLLESRSEIERLLEQDRQIDRDGFRTLRSPAYLAWRYAGHPFHTYCTVYLEHRGELTGCAIFRADTYHTLKGIILDELLLKSPDGQAASALVDQLIDLARVDYVLTCLPGQSWRRRVLEKRGFRRLPWRTYNLAVRLFDPEFEPAALDVNNWDLTPGEMEETWAWR